MTIAVRARPDEAEFRMLAGDPAAQGRGVGRVLVLSPGHDWRPPPDVRLLGMRYPLT